MIQYTASYFTEDHKNWFNNPNYRLFSKIYRIISSHGHNSSVVDIGCGNGDFLKFLQQKNPDFSLTGIDMSDHEPSGQIKFIQGDFLTTHFNQQFDIVVSLATIEHIQDVTAFIQKAYSICKSNGLVIIMTINDGGMIYTLSRLLKRYLFIPWICHRLYSHHHLNHFNTSSLKKLIEINNLELVKFLNHNYPIRAVDMGVSSKPVYFSLLSITAAMFFISEIMGNTFLQTAICRKL